MAVWTVYLSFCLLFALDISASPLQENCKETCETGWSKFGFKCFNFFNIPKSWIDAEKLCLAHNGNLASVHTLDEYSFIKNLIQSKNHAATEAWIGGSDAINEGKWLWSDGSKMNLELWAPGQPDYENHEEEDCLGMNYESSRNWNDYTCDWAMPFVCAKK